MATRLQSDEDGKESKWADIDDDEDDWAPDTVEWMDGTKSSVEVAAKSSKPATEANKVSKVKPTTISEDVKPLTNNNPQKTQNAPVRTALQDASNISTQTKPTTSSITNKTVLRPGLQPSAPPTQLRSGGLVLKASAEKPSLTVKQSAPPPTKSPWAPLPPISKMSPVAVNPPAQAQQTYSVPTPPARFGQRESQVLEAMPPPPSPAREIAADDFNRTWRDDRGNKELYNSQSGRYEPVNSRRRSSGRVDQGYRQPAVLQRPSQPAQPNSIERTPATSAVLEMDGPDKFFQSRRRNSSNVSRGSFSQLRRPSLNVPDTVEDGSSNTNLNRNASVADNAHIKSNDRRDKEPIHEKPMSPAILPTKTEQSPLQRTVSKESGTQSNMQAKAIGDSEPQQSNADYVFIQRQVMREKTELARARKREEEEKEEAAKKERIRLKLESLGVPSSEQQDHKQDHKQEAEPDRRIVESPVRQIRKPAKKIEAVSTSSPPKPPIPTSVGEVTQYGMMKVHQPQPLRKAIVSDTSGLDKQSPERLYGQNLAQPNEERGRLSRSISPAKTPKKSVRDEPNTSIGPNEQARAQTDRGKSSASPSKPLTADQWKHSKKAADTLNGWTSSSVPAHSLPGSNVWGAPNTLGNGTFDAGYGHMAPRPLKHHQQAQSSQSAPPGPIAPPIFVKAARAAPQAGVNISSTSDKSANSSVATDSVGLKTRNQQHVSDVPEQTLAAGRPGSLLSQTQIALPRSEDPASNYGINAWKNLPLQLKEAEREEKERLDREYRSMPRNDFQNASFKETFVQTGKAIGTRGERSVLKTEVKYHDQETDMMTATNGVNLSSEPKSSQTASMSNNMVDGYSLRSDVHLGPAMTPVGFGPAYPAQQFGVSRPLSRFFPRSQENLSQVAQVTDPNAPPPPDPSNHPAYAGDNQRPIVHLPIPKAVVKLPPPALMPSSKALPSASAPAVRLGSQPIVNQTAWQNRFDDLLNRKHAPIQSPPKEQAYTVTSASKAPLVVLSTLATVSLPICDESPRLSRSLSSMVEQGSSVVSKPILEDLAEPLPFASRPPVCLPKAPFMNSIRLPFPLVRYTNQPGKTQIASMLTPLYFLEEGERTPAGYRIQIRLPGRETRKAVILPLSRPRQPSYGRRKSHGKPKDTQMNRMSVRPIKATR